MLEQISTATREQQPPEPIVIGGASQLFIDDALIAESHSLQRRLNQPVKAPEPALVPAHSWEGQGLLYPSMVAADDGYRLYYKCRNWSGSIDDTQSYADDGAFRARYGFGKTPICVATTRDGRTYDREPIANAVVPKTNIVLDEVVDCHGIIRDDAAADAARRYKMLLCLGKDWREGLTPAYSADGYDWTLGERHAVTYFGDRMAYWYHPERKTHIAWSRCTPFIPGRVVVEKETTDFDDWSHPRRSHPRLVMMPDRDDSADTRFYGAYPFFYESLWIAYIEVIYFDEARIDTQLATSRDGRTWQRACDRSVFLPNGPHGSFDAYWIVPSFNPPIRSDGELVIPYNGRPNPHRTADFAHVPPGMFGAIGSATLREDGFASLDATGYEGSVTTVPLELPAQRSVLEVNATPFHTEAKYDPMTLQVDVLDHDSKLMATIQADPDDPGRVWRRLRLPTGLPDVVRLRFRLTNARLYSFRVSGD